MEACPHLVKELFNEISIRELIVNRIIAAIDEECSHLCRKSVTNPAVFRMQKPQLIESMQWSEYIHELESKAPMLLKIISGIVSHSDRRNKVKCGDRHIPGICMAVAVLLKERNKHMAGVQTVVSLLMSAAHVDKQVQKLQSIASICSLICSMLFYRYTLD